MTRALLAAMVAALVAAPAASAAPGLDQAVLGMAYVAQDADVAGGTVVVRDAKGRVLGRTRTSKLGGFIVRSKRLAAGRRIRVTVRGGRVRGKRFRGTLRAVVDRYRPPSAVAVNPLTTIAAELIADRRARTQKQAEHKAKRVLRIPGHRDVHRHVAHSERYVDYHHVRHHARVHGGYHRWVDRTADVAADGGRVSSLGSRRPVARASGGGAAAAIFLLSQAMSGCGESPIPGVGYAVAAMRDLKLSNENPACAALRDLATIKKMLADIQQTLTQLEHRMDQLLNAINQVDYDVNASALARDVADVGQGIRMLEGLARNGDYQQGDLRDVLDALGELRNRPSRFHELLSSTAGRTGVLQAAWNLVRGQKRFVTRAQQDAYQAIEDYWYEQAGHAVVLVAEYYNGFNGVMTPPGGDRQPLSADHKRNVIDSNIRLASDRPPELTLLHVWMAYDPNPVYTDHVGDGSAQGRTVSGTPLVWSHWCPAGNAVSVMCSTSDWYAGTNGENTNCVSTRFPLTREDGHAWNVPLWEQWRTLTSGKDRSGRIANWLSDTSEDFFPVSSTWAFFLSYVPDGDSACRPTRRRDNHEPNGVHIINTNVSDNSDAVYVAGPLQSWMRATSMLVRPPAPGERFVLTPPDFAPR